MDQNSGRTFLINKFLKNFFEEIEFPGEENQVDGGGKYKFEDFGIFLPTIVSNFDYIETQIDFSTGQDSSEETIEDVTRYDFIIQMAWTPRTPAERFNAMTTRKAEEEKQAEAAAEAAAKAAEQNKEGA